MKQVLTILRETKNYTENDILKEVYECVAILNSLGFHAIKDNSYDVKISSRLRKILGQCEKHAGTKRYTIIINRDYLRSALPASVHNTIMHEVIHSLPGCFNHGTKWKAVAHKVNENYIYEPITRTHDLREDTYKIKYAYNIKCNSCGSEWNYLRLTKTYRAAKAGRATCGCGGRSFTCKQL